RGILFLLWIWNIESVGSTIFGPRIVTGLVGGSVTVRCFYPDTSVNRHDRKYWCKESTRRCETIVSSNGYVHPKYQDRANLTDYPDQGIFVVTMSNLEQKDMGAYKCGIVEVDVIQGTVASRLVEIIIFPFLSFYSACHFRDYSRTIAGFSAAGTWRGGNKMHFWTK
uniref:Ig-like domain-containing protein n=1 Tax=Crocodylus porosus TaxID=8502 RepID=A0A7M4FP59_CROPO